MDKTLLATIQKTQENYFNAVKETDTFGNEIKNGQYNQVLENEKLGYRVDVYEGPNGKGFCICEEKVEFGITYHRSYHYGPETYRDANNGEWIKNDTT